MYAVVKYVLLGRIVNHESAIYTALSYIEPKFAYFLDWHHMKEKFISVDDKLSEDVGLE